jgi:NAD(P)-dependent dehydrogenase (short-subunit alcohol dehydrogenase family)
MLNARLTGKTILITGAGSGMGRSSAIRLAREGANLVLLGRQLAPLEEVIKEISTYRSDATYSAVSCDISDPAQMDATFSNLKYQGVYIDGVFANAGVLGNFAPLRDTSTTQLDDLITTNLKGTFLTLKKCLDLMKSGSIVINASWTASAVMPGAGAYAATKGALLAMSKTLAVEEGPKGIRVNAISPGIILTPMADLVLSKEAAQQLADKAALKRNGNPEDVTGTVAWLMSDDSQFVTGQEIFIDGGFSLGGNK